MRDVYGSWGLKMTRVIGIPPEWPLEGVRVAQIHCEHVTSRPFSRCLFILEACHGLKSLVDASYQTKDARFTSML